MDIRGFQVWAFGGARADTRAAAREALAGTVGPERGRGIEGSDRAWCGRGSALSALRERGGGFARYGAGSAALPVQGLRQDLQRAERYAAVGPAPQGTLAVVRGVAGEGGDGEGLGGALRRGGEHGVPLASPVSGGGAERFGGAQGDRGSGRDLRPGEPEGRARAGTQGHGGGAARRRSAASRASRCRFSWRRTGAGRRSARCCPGSMRRRSRLPSIRWSRRRRPAGLRRRRELPTLRRRARGEPRSTQPLDGGTGSGRSACADGEQPPQ